MHSWEVKQDLMISSLWGLCSLKDGFELSPPLPRLLPRTFILLFNFSQSSIQFLDYWNVVLLKMDLKLIV